MTRHPVPDNEDDGNADGRTRRACGFDVGAEDVD
jgi:hypothetical protein